MKNENERMNVKIKGIIYISSHTFNNVRVLYCGNTELSVVG